MLPSQFSTTSWPIRRPDSSRPGPTTLICTERKPDAPSTVISTSATLGFERIKSIWKWPWFFNRWWEETVKTSVMSLWLPDRLSDSFLTGSQSSCHRQRRRRPRRRPRRKDRERGRLKMSLPLRAKPTPGKDLGGGDLIPTRPPQQKAASERRQRQQRLQRRRRRKPLLLPPQPRGGKRLERRLRKRLENRQQKQQQLKIVSLRMKTPTTDL